MMPSKFPGMDPYLERLDTFHSFHNIFVVELQRQLTPQLVPKYATRTDSNIYVTGDDGVPSATYRPDLGISETGEQQAKADLSTIDEPRVGRVAFVGEPQRDWYLEILDAESRRLVTVIELLSPANKRPGRRRDSYLTKRETLLASEVHLVEIDLLRGGPSMPFEESVESEYLVMVSDESRRPEVSLWPIGLKHTLPTITIPLRNGDRATADLQSAFDAAFETGGFAYTIYDSEPEPPLSAEQLAWVASLSPS